MNEPNRLSVPGERAARQRLEDVFARVDELGPLDLANLGVPLRDPERRDALLADLRRAVQARGLGSLLDQARTAVHDALLARTSSEFPAGTYSVTIRGSARVEDQVALMNAIEDVVAVAVAEDVIEADVARSLAEPGRAILGLPPLRLAGAADDPPPGADADPPWAPSARDWEEAAREAAPVERGALLPGVRGMWIAFLAIAAVTGVIAALGWGVTAGEPLVGALIAVAVVAVCWTLATFRRAA